MAILAKKNKDKTKLLRRMQKKLWIAFFIICILFTTLIGRIMYIQYTSGSRYEKQVLSQLSYESNIIPYKRGDITDTNGTILATSIDVYALVLDAYLLNQAGNDVINSTITYLRRFFPDIDETVIRGILRDNPEGRYNVLKKLIPYNDMMAFYELMHGEDTSKEIAGIWFEKSYIRTYPYGSLAADVIGFASAEGNGAIGLENSYNDLLCGTNGRTYGYLDNDYTKERRTESAINGKTLVTTIDVNIQNILENEIAAFNERMAGDGKDGSLETAALIMDPNNGDILAMADYPTFDLNNPRELSSLYTEEVLEVMSNEDKLKELNKLWQNFAVTHTFEPGSTFKPFTVACGLETGAINGSEVFECDGLEHIGDWTVKCVNVYGHGPLTVAGSLEESCNDALMQMSYRIGSDNFAYYQRLFGFGQRTNVDITGEARTDKVVFSKEELDKTINLATNSFGQNFNVTMIQLATAFCSLINGGTMYEPHVVKSVLDYSGGVVRQRDAVAEKITISKETCEQLKYMLKGVVENGTGKTAGVEGYSIGGKTGTAEKLPRGQNNYLVSFIGFAPVENPKVLIYIVVDEPNTPDQAHSSFAQEIVHNVLEQILPYMNIEKEVIPETEEVE